MTIIEEIAAERRRQIEVEGWTAEHDDEHVNGELTAAAACYASPDLNLDADNIPFGATPPSWPWDVEWWKPKGRRHDLIRAGALIVAEIERLDRLALREEPQP